MSTLWTPGGERPVGGAKGPRAVPDPGPETEYDPEVVDLDDPEVAEQLAELQERLAATPVELVVANHAYGLFELAALHLGLRPPQLEQARTAIDALGALVEGMPGRLGDHEDQLREGLAQLRLAFVQVQAAASANPGG